MSIEQDQRPTFYQGQYLGPDDLTATVEYSRIRQARHSLGAHTWGIAMGLQLVEKPSPDGNNQVDMFLAPGYAWDGFGRPIVVLSSYKVPPALFQNIVYDGSVDDPSGHLVKIWLRYSESANQPPAVGFEVCNGNSQTARVQETFGLEVGELTNISDQRDPLSIGGKPMDALDALKTFDPSAGQVFDASIPQQALPEDNGQAQWLVPVGYVRWLPPKDATQTGSFQSRTTNPNDLPKSESARQYIGVVAGTVEAAGQNVQIKLRTKQPSNVASDDLLWVEGKTRIEGDLSLLAGKLSFLNAGGQDEGVPLLLQRIKSIDPNTSKTLTSLQIEIGADNKGNNLLSVGPLDGKKNLVPLFNVLDAGSIGIGTTTPDRNLTIQNSGGTYLNLKDTTDKTEVLLGADGNGGIVSTISNHDLILRSGGNVDRMILKNTGFVGIGTDSPTGALTVAGIVQPGQGNLTFFSQTGDVEYDGGNDKLFVFHATENANTVFIGGNVGIGTNNPQSLLDIAGQIQLGADGTLKSTRLRLIQLMSSLPGPLPINAVFNTGGGTVLIFASGSGYSGDQGRVIGMEIFVDGIPRANAQTMTNESNSHKAFVANAMVIAGLFATSHTLSVQTLPNTKTDANDFFSVTLLELPF